MNCKLMIDSGINDVDVDALNHDWRLSLSALLMTTIRLLHGSYLWGFEWLLVDGVAH